VKLLRSSVDRKIVVVAQSARMLSQLAVNAGFLPIAIDCFADLDTRQLALDNIKVDSLCAEDLLPALRAVTQRHGVKRLVYGSGFEAHPDSLELIERDWQILGNSMSVFRRLQNKREFFAELSALGIPYPETIFSRPPIAGEWLYKPNQGQGGQGIVYADHAVEQQPNGYWQQLLQGGSFSALFVANGENYKILGFNRQWTVAVNDHTPFIFAGIHNQARLAGCYQRVVSFWLKRLLDVYPFRGLASLDFLVSGDRCYFLEINPRIPASSQLYGHKLFSLHLSSCQGTLSFRGKVRARPRGYQIVYSSAEARLPMAVSWPSWAVDLPESGAIIGQGQPICSIIAGGKNVAQVSRRLQQRQQIIENLLNIRTINSHAIPSKCQ
jgi:predicted ATP-grasp superfamily ATP-dependent carboligase